MVVMSILANLPLDFSTAKPQILSNSEISSLYEISSRILCTKSRVSIQMGNEVISKTRNYEHDEATI